MISEIVSGTEVKGLDVEIQFHLPQNLKIIKWNIDVVIAGLDITW